MGEKKTVSCTPIKIKIVRIIEQERVKDGCVNTFKTWEVEIDDGSFVTMYNTEDRGKILLDILHAMVR